MSDYQAILKKYWGYDDFRGIQREIIESIGSGHDTLGLMPTGGGKSITFQVPALSMYGVCIVVTPLIALMKDQVMQLHRFGIRAAAIYSGMNHDDIVVTLENAVFNAYKLLYVSPERLNTSLFLNKLRHMHVSFICVDEAHCISQWGYDFRPSYLSIADIRKELPSIPILALTATATPLVVDDIQERLHFREKRVYRMSFERKNLAYVIRKVPDKEEQLIHILRNTEGSAIVYARSRQRTKEISEMLCREGFSATFFHAGLESSEKDQRQHAWQLDKVRVMVATNAFGMGIDKPDVREVLHIDCPSSIEAYFQEAGRAGRDGKKAYAILLYNNSDQAKLHKRITDTFPEKEFIRDIYDHLAYFYQIGIGGGFNSTFEFPIDKFCLIYKYFPIQVESALKILDRAGYIEYTEEQDHQARVMFLLERDELYKLQNQSPNEEKIITALLRSYSGLFSNYAYIDESMIAMQTELERPIIYQCLKSLAEKHIIDFIPQKRIPFIRYRQRREESEFLQFPPSVYEDLRTRFTERIEAILQYIHTDNQCRSRQLLRYFGETESKDCGICDVCLNHTPIDIESTVGTINNEKDAQDAIIQVLNDGNKHDVRELHSLNIDYEILDEALMHLIYEGTVIDDDGQLYLS